MTLLRCDEMRCNLKRLHVSIYPEKNCGLNSLLRSVRMDGCGVLVVVSKSADAASLMDGRVLENIGGCPANSSFPDSDPPSYALKS